MLRKFFCRLCTCLIYILSGEIKVPLLNPVGERNSLM